MLISLSVEVRTCPLITFTDFYSLIAIEFLKFDFAESVRFILLSLFFVIVIRLRIHAIVLEQVIMTSQTMNITDIN